MGEIKSAIELAMERTKDIVIDAKERQALQTKDIENKMRIALRRYLENLTNSQGTVRELNNIQGDEKTKKSILIDLFLEEFDLNKENNKRLFAIFHLVDSTSQHGHLKEEMEVLEKDFADEVKKREGIVRRHINNRLKEMGITGSAVEPNIEAWGEWQEALDEVQHSFIERVSAWKEKVTQTFNHQATHTNR